ncbi:hypothetical protein D4S03_03360 [bacterium]|nr:MAG: hypothetical protein D4S03_03360 [bacterium]
MKLVDGEIEDLERDGRWVSVRETAEGGAKLMIDLNDLECLDRVSTKLGEAGRIIEGIVNEKGDEMILVDYVGKQIPFEEVMKALFG